MLLLAIPAQAGQADDAAVRASEVQGEHCNRILREDAALEAAALSVVAGALGQVAEAYEATHKPFLLYWRGVLAECIGYDDDARVDLLAFWNKTQEDADLATQRDDAVRRLRRLGVSVVARRRVGEAGMGVGMGVVAGGGVLAGLAGWQKSELDRAQTEYEAGDLLWVALEDKREEGEAAADGANAFTGAAIGLAVGGAAAIVIQAVVDGGPQRVTWAPVVVPTSDGAVVTVAGRW